MIKKTLKALGKTVVAGIVASLILTLLYFFYDSTPLIYPNRDSTTDYKWESNTLYFYGTEGYGWGKTNNEGFMNMFDYDNGMKIDVLIMGSSHMEALQVGMRQSTASKLNALLENETVYNIGFHTHPFTTCARNFRSALNKYQPTKYVVIETPEALFSNEKIALAISEEKPTFKMPSYTDGIIGFLRKSSPFLRRMHKKMKEYYASWLAIREYYASWLAGDEKGAEGLQNFAESDTVTNEKSLDDLLRKMSTLAEEYGTKVIIAYHPYISIASDGTMNLNDDENAITQFKRLCNANGMLFLDMSERFKEEYEKNYILPYGFSNSPVGQGHMNKYGHAMMAEELYKLILEDEQ